MEKYSLLFRDRMVESIVQRGRSKFVQLSLEPGQGLTKHRAGLALSVIVLSGQVKFSAGGQLETLNASTMITVDPNVEHAIEAIETSTVLLVLTPDGTEEKTSKASRSVDHENAYLHPELKEQIHKDLLPLVEDHVEVCKVLESVKGTVDLDAIDDALKIIQHELNSHFKVEEDALFPHMARHVGGIDVGPVARLLEEHERIRQLHREAGYLMEACRAQTDDHTTSLLRNKVDELSTVLLNHLGKEDSHLFPMASRLLTAEELSEVADRLRQENSSDGTV